jgi:TonB family C-terminal domain
MLETLLESKSKRERSVAGTIASVVTHTTLVAAALYGTAQARVQPIGSPETVRTVYFPPAQNHAVTAQPTTARPQHSANNRSLIFVDPHIDINLPRMDINGVVSRPGDFSPGPITATRSSNDGENGAGSTGTPFRADQVEKQVTVMHGSPTPRYPELLRSSGVEGRVMAEFVVDEQGLAVEESVRFVRSDNALFEDAVRVALRRMRFVPAEVGGRKVKQLVQMPFVFTLGR